MARVLSATMAGAVIYYIWGMLAWMLLPIHGPTVAKLPEEQQIIEAMRAQDLASGVYIAPFTEDPEEMSDPDSTFMKNHTQGPIFSIYYRKEGAPPMGIGVLLGGFVIDIMAAGLAVCLLLSLGPCGNSYWCRVGFVTGLGVFVGIIGHLSYWNWMYFPTDYTLAFVADVVIGWFLAGLAIAALVRPTTAPTQTVEIAREEPKSVPQPQPKAPEVKKPVRSDAISLLAALQREARFIDIVKEPLSEFSDAQIGAAARDVLRDCGAVLDRMFELKPIMDEEDGAEIEIPDGDSAAKIRITGNSSDSTKSATLVHHGWEAQQCELPQWTGKKNMALVIAQAEAEAK